MAETSNNIRAVQGVGIVAAGYTAGAIFCLSHVAIPVAQVAPTNVMLKQWSNIFSRGLRTGPPLAAVSAFSFGYLAYALPSMRKLYTASALLPLVIFPWTRFLMVPLNTELFRSEAAAGKLKEGEELTDAKGAESSMELVTKWGSLNYIRSLFPLAGALLGAYSALNV